jgi:hypothetical protein
MCTPVDRQQIDLARARCLENTSNNREEGQMKRRLTLSYEQILSTTTDDIERLAEGDLIDEGTRERLDHLGRFFHTIGQKMQKGSRVNEVFTEEQLRVIWFETAGDHPAVGDLPLSVLH